MPYANTSFSKDMKDGSVTVKIGGKAVMLKDQSYYNTSPLGDEAATKAQGAGVITHVITGKTYFSAWSMDVKFEGKNVDRHTDITTSNHASPLGNASTPMPNMAKYSPVQQEAVAEGKHKCECCGGLAHSAAQAAGEYMTEDEFYDTAANPKNAQLLARIRSNPNCRHLLPTEGKKARGCNKYYRTTTRETKRIQTDWGLSRPAYVDWKNVEPRDAPVAHRVPKAAGGCPAGQGNLAPAGAKCVKLESQLSELQERCADRFGPR